MQRSSTENVRSECASVRTKHNGMGSGFFGPLLPLFVLPVSKAQIFIEPIRRQTIQNDVIFLSMRSRFRNVAFVIS